jgi:hypothetical protein
LKIGDQVLIGSNNAQNKIGKSTAKFSKVVTFLHRVPDVNAQFVRLFYKNQFHTESITLTPRHLILAKTNNLENDFKYLPANEVAVDAKLKLFDHNSQSFRTVVVVRKELIELERSGIYAPLTESGTLIVDNIHASCYSIVKYHKLAQLVFSIFNKFSFFIELSSEAYTAYSKILLEILNSLKLSSYFMNV